MSKEVTRHGLSLSDRMSSKHLKLMLWKTIKEKKEHRMQREKWREKDDPAE